MIQASESDQYRFGWRSLLIIATVAVCWPYLPWLWRRWFEGNGEMWRGILFVALCGFALFRTWCGRRRAGGDETVSLVIAGFFLAVLFFLGVTIPRLLCAGLAISAWYWVLRFSLPEREAKRSFAAWPLAILCLPIGPSLQYVLGYPLRRTAAVIAAWLLPGNVRAVGCGLTDGRLEVFVDAPCAGAAMLASSLTLAAVSALIFGLGMAGTLLLLFSGLLCALGANALRAALLYAANAGILPIPTEHYEAVIGLLCFAVIAILIATFSFWLSKRQLVDAAPAEGFAERSGAPIRTVYLLLCIAIGVGSFWKHESPPAATAAEHKVVWPSTWQGKRLSPIPPSTGTAAFWKDFPGAYQEFMVLRTEDDGVLTGNGERILLRYVSRPTRQLHPAEDCFRGAGYTVTPQPLWVDSQGRRWSSFVGLKNGERVTVQQCLFSVSGPNLQELEAAIANSANWSDISSWYWDRSILSESGSSLTLAITIIN